jgi:hypothetical protein
VKILSPFRDSTTWTVALERNGARISKAKKAGHPRKKEALAAEKSYRERDLQYIQL